MKYKKLIVSLLLVLMARCFSQAQIVLNANGSDTTYKLINAILAPGYDVIETPDCVHTTVKHIDQVYDADLDKHVFRFKAHVHLDNDRCINFDRQRTEIKTYDKSPENLKATLNEKVEYSWRFKLSSDFKPSLSFTHLHQIKAVGGPDESMPLITLTARESNPDQLELRYAEELSQSTIIQVPLEDFRGEWVQATETILFQEKGKATYSIELKRMSDSVKLLEYSSTSLKMWKTDADFLRPKWGIYRSLLDSMSLKDEDILFSDISINELTSANTKKIEPFKNYHIYPNPCQNMVAVSKQISSDFNLFSVADISGKVIRVSQKVTDAIDVSDLKPGVYYIQFVSTRSGELNRQKIVKY
jgi:hypothetical protein